MKSFLSVNLIFALFVLTFQSCKKESNEPVAQECQLEISFSADGLKSANSQNLTHVIVTIEDHLGNVVKDFEKIEIFNMNGLYISKPISLLTGDYKLTKFLVLTDANTVAYATPIEGSDKAYLVQEPLPKLFTVQKDIVNKLIPEVLSTVESNPKDFGYATFCFDIAETFDFLVGAFVYNDISKNFELTTASISIYSDATLIYSGELQANGGVKPGNYNPLGITNKITLPEKYEEYTIEISKDSYINYSKDFTIEELRLYYRSEDKGPLVVILNKEEIPGLVAYYPFNGDYEDKSGNNFHGTNYGSIFSLDKNNSNNSAIEFDGTNDHVILASDFDYVERSISVWFYASNIPVYDYVNNPETSWHAILTCDHLGLSNGNIKLNVSKVNGTDMVWFSQCWGYVVDPDILSTSISENVWYHAVVTISAYNVNFYINGSLIGTHPSENINSGNGSLNMLLGCSRNINNRYLDGGIDELRIYDRVLNQQEIQQLFDEGV
jgi:hypothetical protein